MMRFNFHTKIISFCFLVLSIFGTETADGQNSRVSIKGTIERIVVEENPVRYEYVLAADDERRYQLSASESLVNYANRKVSLSGILDGKLLNVKDKIKVAEEAKALSSPAPTFGSRKVLTLLVNFTNNQTQPISVEQARARVFTGATSANRYFKEASYYRYELTGIQRPDGDVLGWMTLPFTDAGCESPENPPFTRWTEGADVLARQNGYEPNNYNSVIYVFPHLCGRPGFASSGLFGNTELRRVWLSTDRFREYEIIHELGHNLGLGHADGMRCSGTNIPSDCQGYAYGDPFDEMGAYSDTASFFFNNHFRLFLGWLSGRAQTVTVSGDYTLVAPSLPAKGNQVLRIPLMFEGLNYTLEFRRPFSFDNRFFGSGYDSNPAFKGVSIRYTIDAPGGISTSLMDTTPSTPTFLDAPLTVGNTFTDTNNGITITTLSVNPMRGARVRIQLNR